MTSPVVVVIDLDRCLLDRHHKVSEANRLAIEEVHSEGAMIVIATGRMPTAVEPLLERLPPVSLVVALNGALVTHMETRRILHRCPMGHDALRFLVSWTAQEKLQVALCSEDTLWFRERDITVDAYVGRTGVCQGVLDNDSFPVETMFKALVYAPVDHPICESETVALLERSPLPADYVILETGHGYVEVCPPGVAKELGLEAGLHALGLRPRCVFAIGDGANDVGLLRIASHSYAVANACEAAKIAADWVVADCDNDGVAEALRHFASTVALGC